MIAWDRIEELKAELGEDDFAEVAALFLQEAQDTLQGLANRASANDLHFLKGLALNLGFTALADLCQAAEDGAVTPPSALRDCFARSKTAFEARAYSTNSATDSSFVMSR